MLILSVIYTVMKVVKVLLKRCQDHISCSFAYKLVCVDDTFSKQIVVYRGENAALNLLKQCLKCMSVVKK